MSSADDFVSANAEIVSTTCLGVTGWKEKALTVMYLLLIFSPLGWFLNLLTIRLIGSGSLKESDESGHLSNPTWCYGLKINIKLSCNFYCFKTRPLAESIMLPEVFIPLFKN